MDNCLLSVTLCDREHNELSKKDTNLVGSGPHPEDLSELQLLPWRSHLQVQPHPRAQVQQMNFRATQRFLQTQWTSATCSSRIASQDTWATCQFGGLPHQGPSLVCPAGELGGMVSPLCVSKSQWQSGPHASDSAPAPPLAPKFTI